MDKVWIVMKGEAYEGGGIMDVFHKKKDAQDVFERLKYNLSSCDWVDIEEYEVK